MAAAVLRLSAYKPGSNDVIAGLNANADVPVNRAIERMNSPALLISIVAPYGLDVMIVSSICGSINKFDD